MKPSKFSTVIEIFFPNSWTRDFEMIASQLGHAHYGVWFDRLLFGDGRPKAIAMPEGFQGNEITVDAPTVVGLIEERLAGWSG